MKYFPNKKTSINFEDFCTIYNDSMESLSKDDDMIAKIFEMFDLDADGKLNAFNIKQILEVFGFKSNIQDVKSKNRNLVVFGFLKALVADFCRCFEAE